VVRLSYTVILGDNEFAEPNKDEVISLLIQQWNDRTGLAITVIWPDGSRIVYEGFD
jgi:hypothetical protein